MARLGHLVTLVLLLYQVSAQTTIKPSAGKPNVVFILTDDQDKHLDSLEHMQAVKKHLIEEGTTFERHYCTVALCCPSRVNLLTGKLAHNTNVTDLRMPFGKLSLSTTTIV